MTTTPPEEPQTPPPASGTVGTAWFGITTADARMPIPGNAEFLLYSSRCSSLRS